MDRPTLRREVAVEERLERHRRELIAHCRQMLRSSSDAEDAVQETMVRAWRAFDRYEGRAALRTWLHRIATNVCVDMLRSRHRHPLPVDLASTTPDGSARSAAAGGAPPAPGWGGLSLDGRGVSPDRGPEDVAMDREATSQAFLALLQLLPARQRAVLILHQVLRWKAAEVAELFGTTVAAVNSALQRARATMASSGAALVAGSDPTHPTHPPDPDPAQRSLLDRYVDAFTHDDVQSLVTLAMAGARDGAATTAGGTGVGAGAGRGR